MGSRAERKKRAADRQMALIEGWNDLFFKIMYQEKKDEKGNISLKASYQAIRIDVTRRIKAKPQEQAAIVNAMVKFAELMNEAIKQTQAQEFVEKMKDTNEFLGLGDRRTG